jgi:type I restriction enzyme, S subunit
VTIATVNISQGWQKIRLKRIANLHPSKNEVANLSDDMAATFLPMEAVGESWEVDYSRTRPLSEIRNGYTYFRDGDILVAKITPCFENGKGALVNGCLNGFGFGTTEFHVIRSPNSETTRFLSYVVRSHRFKFEGAGMMTGTAGQKRLSDDYVKDFEVFLPPILKREQIASFLDRKTATIDTLIAKKQRLIQLLEEKRTALINQAVTKGLNPNAPMKESGIPWIGEIPEHWTSLKLRQISKIYRGKFTHRPRNDPKLYGGVYPFLQTGDIARAGKFIENYSQTLNELGKDVSQCFPSQTIVMSIAANIGDIAITAFDAYFPDSVLGFTPKSLLCSDFLYYLLLSMKLAFDQEATENTQKNLNIERVGSIDVPLPPLDEQDRVVKHLETNLERQNEINKLLNQQIEKLQEYRRSLITAAVTGKLDISGVTLDHAC